MMILARKFKDLVVKEPVSYSVGIKGSYKVQVCRDGKVIREPFGPNFIPNLITDSGLDFLMSTSEVSTFSQAIRFCRAGTGTATPLASDTNLGTPVTSTNTFTGSGSGYSNDTVNGAWTTTYSFEFATEVTTISYTEVGLSDQPSTGLRTHTLFPTAVVLNGGDNLRLVYSFTYSIPALVTPISISLAPVGGFDVSGNLKVAGTYSSIFGTVASTAVAAPSSPSNYLPAMLCGAPTISSEIPFLLSAPTTFPAVNTSITETLITGATGTFAWFSYTNGSFQRSVTMTWVPSHPSGTVTNVNMIRMLGNGTSTAGNAGLYLLLNTAQTKANTNTLTITLQTTLSRV